MKRELGTKQLDAIGKSLIKSDARQAVNIDEIVANPALFEAVRAKIAADASSTPRHSRFFSRVGVAFAGTVAVAAMAFAFTIFRAEAPIFIVRSDSGQTSAAKPTPFRDPDLISDPAPPEQDTQIKPERISATPVARATTRPKRRAIETNHSEGEFYALSYAGDPNETERGGRIIRVDMPRSALFAMGVNIPLENEAEMIKTDLLVGNDGVTRAIRVVK